MLCPPGPAAQAPGLGGHGPQCVGPRTVCSGLGLGSIRRALRGRWCLKLKGSGEVARKGRKVHPGGRASQRASWALGVGRDPEASLCPAGSQVVTVDVRNKKAVFKDGFKLEYSKLLLAPGSRWEGSPRPCRYAEGSGAGSPAPTLAVSQP